MRTSRILALVLAGTFVIASCASTEPAATTTEPTTPTTVPLASVPSDYVGYLRQPTACGAAQPELATDMKFEAPGDASVEAGTRVTLNTSCGLIEITLDLDLAPEAVNSFVFLAESGFFDGTVSHRVIPGFMMQAGDPTATGLGGPGYAIPDESPPEGTIYARGTVAMANSGPGTTGSQFFIMFEEADWLPTLYTIIGVVTSGFETLERIAEIPLGRNANGTDPDPSTPLETLFIESVTVDR